jgi:capsular polysaccharide biosynthesis protein
MPSSLKMPFAEPRDAVFGLLGARRHRIVQFAEIAAGPLLPVGAPAARRVFPVPEPLFGRLPQRNDFELPSVSYDRRLGEIHDARLVGDDGFVVSGGSMFLIDPAWVEENILSNPAFRRPAVLPARRLPGAAFSCLLYWGDSYYHWICDVLCRLHDVLHRLPPEVRFIVPSVMEPWKWRSLELIGVPPDRCVQRADGRALRIERLFHAGPVAMTGDHEPDALRWIRDRIWNGVLGGAPAANRRRRLYLTRRGGRARAVTNEAELQPALSARGFEMVRADRLSFDEQVRLFADAAVVVAPHGAALTNLLWSPPGVRILELFEPGTLRRCYWSLAHHLGHSYHCGIATPAANPGGEANMTVPLAPFVSALDSVIAG